MRADAAGPRPMLKALSPQRYGIQFTIGQSTQDKLTYARELLGHQIPGGDLAALLDRALDALIAKLEKQKFGATERPRPPRAITRSETGEGPGNPRRIPTEVKRAVWTRDGGRCTFVSETGRRCEATGNVEFDHVTPAARGGRATVGNLRLRCRAHNQYEAERAFGAGFMHERRATARAAAARRAYVAAAEKMEWASATAAAEETRIRNGDAAAPAARGSATAPDPDRDVTPWLRALGFRADQAHRAAGHCEGMTDASLEDRVRAALSFLGGPHRRVRAD